MLLTKARAGVIVVASVALCCAVPTRARAQVTLVETVPRSTSTTPRWPFSMDAPNMKAASRLAGCYALTLGPWSKPEASGATISVPSRIDLTSDPHTRIYIGFRLVARTPGFADEREKYPPAWGPIGADSMQVRAWADGSSSLMLFLRRQRDGQLRGTARYFAAYRIVDSTGRWMWETYPSAAASLRPAPCDSSGS